MDNCYEILELNKILEMLAAKCSNDRTRELALALTPSTDYDDVCLELDRTAAAFTLSVRFGSPSFYRFRDITGAVKRAKSGARLSLRELLDIAVVLRQVQLLRDWRGSSGEPDALSCFFDRLCVNRRLEEKISTAIVSDEEIADAASSALASIRRKINQAGLKLRGTLDQMIRSSAVQKSLQEAIVTIRDGRFVLPVKIECKSEVPGLIHSTSASGQTIFVEPMSVVEANNEIRLLESMEQEEIERIVMELCEDCATFSEELLEDYEVCCTLDLYFAKANLGATMNAAVPKLSTDGLIKLKGARHPLIDKKKVVPIDITVGESYDALIITGPNTGGKTVALKTTGLLTAMTMCGLLIPTADGSVISIFKKLLVDIGDSQSIEESLSTFSAHTNKVIEILNLADSESLVLLDEIGSGTDPVEGAALAVAIIERLKEQGAKMLVTTHYQELKLFALEGNGVENASCEFDVETLTPTYRLIIGTPGKSNAFAISTNLGMPQEIIEYAQSLVGSENSRFEMIVEQLEKQRVELERQNEEIRALRIRLREDSEEAARKLAEVKAAKETELEKARVMARRIIEDTKAQSNELIDELDRLRKEKDRGDFAQRVSEAKSKSGATLDKLHDAATPALEKSDNSGYKLPRKLRPGDSVYLVDLDKNGTVVSADDTKAMVQIGIMKSKVAIDRLRLVDEKPSFKSGHVSKRGVTGAATRRPSMELDIRGQAADEGVYELEGFIDDAVLSGLSTVTIIHGKGTGILRAAVHRKLKSMKAVKDFRLGKYGEGEDGVTIVELK